MRKIIFHIDVNSAFLSWTALDLLNNGASLDIRTVPAIIGQEARAALDSADVIISKGQGNCESLYGYERNIYYAFLVKCDRFIRQFGKPKFTPMLTK